MTVRIKDGPLEMVVEIPAPTMISTTEGFVARVVSEFLRMKGEKCNQSA